METSSAEAERLAELRKEIADTGRQIAEVPNYPSVWVGEMSPAPGPFKIFLGGDPSRTGKDVTITSPSAWAETAVAYSLAAESMYDHSFQWGSKRTGPDLARVGDRYSNEWHVQHLIEPRDVVPESVMPSYSFLKDTPLAVNTITMDLKANRAVGVPYTDKMIENAAADIKAQADPDADTSGIEARYPKAKLGDFDGNPQALTEMDALVAYLQMLGTLVDVNAAAAQEDLARETGR